MATCRTPDCTEQHGLVDHLCHDCRRWTELFDREELAALELALRRSIALQRRNVIRARTVRLCGEVQAALARF